MDSSPPAPEVVVSPTLLFRVGAHLYGCDVAEAREIVPLRRMTRLPGAPPFVRGLMNMRGTIVTVLDLGVRLEPGRGPTRQGSILLVRHGDRVVGLIVDHVTDVRVLSGMEPAGPGLGSTAVGGIVKGMATADDKTVVILDVEALISQVLLS